MHLAVNRSRQHETIAVVGDLGRDGAGARADRGDEAIRANRDIAVRDRLMRQDDGVRG